MTWFCKKDPGERIENSLGKRRHLVLPKIWGDLLLSPYILFFYHCLTLFLVISSAQTGIGNEYIHGIPFFFFFGLKYPSLELCQEKIACEQFGKDVNVFIREGERDCSLVLSHQWGTETCARGTSEFLQGTKNPFSQKEQPEIRARQL